MEEKLKSQSIRRLDVKDNVLEILEYNNVQNLGKLCGKSKSDLKKLDLTLNQINKIEVEMQLLGLNLRNSL